MDDLFKKLNTLVKASLNDLLGEESGAARKPLEPGKLGKNIDREIAALRQKINDAVAYEDELEKRVQTLLAEVARWDEQADQAVAAGRDGDARYAIDQMRRAQQRQSMAEADLREHQFVTQDLIRKVNLLEATVADARRAQAQSSDPPAEEAQPAGRTVSDVLREAREKISHMGDLLTAKDEVQHAAPPADHPLKEDETVDDDLAARRQRLSKPK